ncbi:MAG: tRNA preQ1(34) S-adenosylmethionine ribosyltransferase-isomerase QueA [Verrucomicrobiota bacterium]|jgi:S-adenosylmethionine:tRNA ribosyltransferase-isomerase
MSSLLSDYQYDLPPELIADRPAPRRQDSRMLVLHRESGRIEHRGFADLPEYITPQDLLVLNDSKVIPARLHDATGKIEMLLLEQRGPLRWTAMVRPGKKMREGASVEVAGTTATVSEVLDDGTRLLDFSAPPDLDQHGEMPIPPYFHRPSDEQDKERYQTVYAKDPGSVAAPTAGLHFTKEILASLPHAFVTLHVGAGTFHPVKTDDVSEHRMHSEYYSLSEETASRINAAKVSGGRIIAVGTTTTRVLESQSPGPLTANSGSTEIFIRPPHRFRHIDVLQTNFHLPGSTLLMLVSALAGRELILEAYNEAVREKYRFFSYGDCMLIV